MNLSAELLQRFAKITNDTSQTKKESTVYGTIVTTEDGDYVHIDGAYFTDGKRILLPLIKNTTVAVKTDDRVIVSIRNHTAVVTGNLTDPSTSIEHVTTVERSIVHELQTNYAKINNLEVAEAAIGDLIANDILVKNTLETQRALINGKLDATTAEITYAKIDRLNAYIGLFNTLSSDYAAFKETTTNELYADVAEIEKLIFGSAGGNVIQTTFANAVIAQLGNAQIKSAMIDDLDTSKVMIKSADGRLIISDETIQISDADRVRVQIGKDASNDYSISVWDANGALMFSKGGITGAAIKNAIIRNDMVASDANISAGKIFVSDKNKTLDLAFKEMSSEVTEMGETITSQGSEITALKESISTKVWKQDISNVQIGGRNLLKNSRHIVLRTNNVAKYPVSSSLESENDREFYRYVRTSPELYPEVMSVYSTIPTSQLTERLTEKEVTFSFLIRCSHDTVISIMGLLIDSTDEENGQEQENFGVSTMIIPIGTNWKRISITTSIKLDYEHNASNVLRFNPNSIKIPTGEIENFYVDVCEWKIELGNKATDWTPAPEDTEGAITTLSTKYTLLEQDVDSITTTVAYHAAQLTENSEEITLAQSTIGQLADSISMLVTDGNGTSLMTQTEDGWTFSTSDIQAAVDRTSEALATLTAQCGDTDAAVEVLQQSVSDLGIMAEYIRIGTHEGEPCIELGEGDSNFKLLITNTRILFMDGSDIPAYINNKSLYIKKAVVEEELHQGGYAWVTRSNGHLSLVWKGAAN